jgi:hypothetical protein
MLDRHPGQGILEGAVCGVLVGVLCVPLVQFFVGALCRDTCVRPSMQMVTAVALALALSMTRPALLRTLLRCRRSPFMLDADLEQTLIGRAIGVALGTLLAWGAG